MCAGYNEVNNAERLAVKPAMRYVVGGRASQSELLTASMSKVGHFQTTIFIARVSIKNLAAIPGAVLFLDWFFYDFDQDLLGDVIEIGEEETDSDP